MSMAIVIVLTILSAIGTAGYILAFWTMLRLHKLEMRLDGQEWDV